MLDSYAANTLSKEERICSKPAIENLMKNGRWGYSGDLRFRWCERGEGEYSRILISVPKRLFKRAVKRNLLKRRIREAYRTQKHLLSPGQALDILFVYSTKEILDYRTISELTGDALRQLSQKAVGS